MEDRLEQILDLGVNLYAKGSPVIIERGELLKHNTNHSVFAKLYLKSIINKKIESVKVGIKLFNSAGEMLGSDIFYEYIDMETKRDDVFGHDALIEPGNNKVRGIAVYVSQVQFADGASWNGTAEAWKALGPLVEAKEDFEFPELYNQYLMEYGKDAIYKYKQAEDIWFCACGAINRNSEKSCHKCNKEASLYQVVDEKKLKADANKRLEKERPASSATETSNSIKRLVVMVIIAVVIVAGVFGAFVIKKQAQNKADYKQAELYMDNGKYQDAKDLFLELGEYKDSKDKAEECTKKIEKQNKK